MKFKLGIVLALLVGFTWTVNVTFDSNSLHAANVAPPDPYFIIEPN